MSETWPYFFSAASPASPVDGNQAGGRRRSQKAKPEPFAAADVVDPNLQSKTNKKRPALWMATASGGAAAENTPPSPSHAHESMYRLIHDEAETPIGKHWWETAKSLR
jgi:hypothetical protein